MFKFEVRRNIFHVIQEVDDDLSVCVLNLLTVVSTQVSTPSLVIISFVKVEIQTFQTAM